MNWQKILKTILFDECACGCGQTTSIGKKYVHGHHTKTTESRQLLSERAKQLKGRTLNLSEEERQRRSLAMQGNKFWVGRHHTDEHKSKMSQIMKSKDLSPMIEGGKKTRFKKGHVTSQKAIEASKAARALAPSPLKGRKLPDAVKSKISQALKGNTYKMGYKDPPEIRAKKSAARLGDKNPAWVDGRTYTAYSRDFVERIRYEIKKRDNHTCQDCHTSESQLSKPLNVHHIDTDRQNNDPFNLVSLCDSCHAKRHRAINRERQRTNRL